MICQDCGIEAATHSICFHQNIGLIFLRLPKTVDGQLCKSCIHKHFWRMTGTTFFLGWWGTISLFVAPMCIINNVIRYLAALPMPSVGPGATRPQLTDEAWEKIKPHAAEIFESLNDGEKLNSVAKVIAPKAEVTPGQVILFVQAVVRSQSKR